MIRPALCLLIVVSSAFGNLLFSQQYTNYAKSVTGALNKLEKKIVQVTLKDSLKVSGKLYSISNYYIISSNDEKSKFKFYSRDVADILLVSNSFNRGVIDSSYVGYLYSGGTKNGYTRKEEIFEPVFDFAKLYITYTAMPISGNYYINANFNNLISAGVSLTDYLTLDAGFDVSGAFSGYESAFIQSKFHTKYDGSFNLAYTTNFSAPLNNYQGNRNWQLIQFCQTANNYWVNLGIGSNINNTFNNPGLVQNFSAGFKLIKNIWWYAEAFNNQGLVEIYSTSIRINGNSGYFDVGFSTGSLFNRVETYYDFNTGIAKTEKITRTIGLFNLSYNFVGNRKR